MRELRLLLRFSVTLLIISGASRALAQTPVSQTAAAPTASQAVLPPARRLVASPAASEPRVALAGSVTDRPLTSASLGHLPAATRILGMSLIVKRTPAQEAVLDQLLHDQQDPHSPSYHHWLTPQTFGDRFGLAPTDLDILSAWLRTQGFEVAEVAPSSNRIVFSGTSAQVEAAFSVTLNQYRRDEQTFFENREPIQLPQSLTAVVSGVTGLSSYRLHSHAIQRPLSTSAPQYTGSTGGNGLVPWDFRQLFDINPLISAGTDGTGVKIGVIGQSAFSATQVSDFQLKTGQPNRMPNLVLVPNTGVSNPVAGDEDESELDIEYATGTAPGSSVQFIYTGCGTTASPTALSGTASCKNDGVFSSLMYAITNNLAPILTLSYGACEAGIASYATSTLEPVLKQANAQGQTILVSSGDTGAATCDQGTDARAATHGLSVSYPASSPYVTAVGGTQLATSGFSSTNNSYGGSATTYAYEQGWNDTVSLGTLASTGGGVSKVFPKPEWQVGTSVPQDGFRDVPDVAFPASILTVPYFACTADASCQANTTIGGTSSSPNGGFYGGTSLSAPNFAAMLAVIEQKNSSGPLGNINPVLYALAQGASASTVFHDVSSGNNTVPCVSGTPDCGESNIYEEIGYGANSGYDQVTGLGSISATALATALAASSASTSLTLSPNPPIVDQPVTFTATVLDTPAAPAPSGTVTFAIDGTAIGSAVPLADGTASFHYSGFTAPSNSSFGRYAITASYSGDAAHAASSATLNLSAAQVPVNLAIASSTASVQTNTPTSFTITATGPYGTPTGYVLLLLDGIYLANAASPFPLVNGVGTYSYPGFSSAGLHEITAQYFSEADKQNFQDHPAGYVFPYTSYEGGSALLDLQVSAPTQTLTPIVTLTASTTGVFAPKDFVEYSILIKGNGIAPTGGYTLTLDGSSSLQHGGAATADGMSIPLTLGGNWTPGTHTVQVTYNGDDNYKPAAPVSATFTVVLPAFTLSTSPATITIANGTSGSTTLTVNAGATYSGQTTFKLGLISYTGAPFSGCYGLSSTSTDSQRGTPASVTLTMYSGTTHCTASNQVRVLSATTLPPQRTLLPLSLASLCVVGFLAFRRKRFLSSLVVLLLSATLFSAMGCGSGTSSSGGSGTGGGGGGGSTGSAPIGTYVIQVTGIGGGNDAVTAKTSFTLTVNN